MCDTQKQATRTHEETVQLNQKIADEKTDPSEDMHSRKYTQSNASRKLHLTYCASVTRNVSHVIMWTVVPTR